MREKRGRPTYVWLWGVGKVQRRSLGFRGEDPRSIFGTLGRLRLGESATMWEGAPRGPREGSWVES
jgi:hypothetical protein